MFLFNFKSIVGQVQPTCADTLFDLDKNYSPPKYKNGVADLNKYIVDELIPIISQCNQTDSTLTTSMYIALRINKLGEVIETRFKKGHLPQSCKDELNKKLLGMKGWVHASVNGRPVCGNSVIPISCLKYR
jgi:hypothetical protein